MYHEFRNTFRIALPLIINNISQVGLGLIDTSMIGAVDYKLLAASSLTLNVIAIPQLLGSGMAIAISPLVAMANGQKDEAKASHILFNGFLLTLFTAILVAVTMVLSHGLLLHLGQDRQVAELAGPFYKLIAWSLIPMLVFQAVKQFCDGLEYTKTAMTLSLLSLPLNAALNWIFIYGHFGVPRMELTGAGLGTLITRCVIATAMVATVFRHRLFAPYIRLRASAWHFKKRTLKELLQIGIPTSMQYALEVGAFSLSGIMMGWLGPTAQAAHQIALNLATATFMAALGLSLAGSIRVANAYGRNEHRELRLIGTSTIAGGLIYGAMCALLFVLLRHQLPLLFTSNAKVATVSATLMVIAALFQVSDATQAIGVGLLRGIRDTHLPTIFVAIAYWAIGIPAGYLLSFRLHLGPSGIWLGFVTGLTASSLLLNTRFLKKTKIDATTPNVR